ncbi:MAG: preprotein translocase subunit SecA [bacterium]|nr:preprotein translocase subunit SecA [bacterium]
MFKFLSKLFSTNEKEIGRLAGQVARINVLEEKTAKLSDTGFGEKTSEFKKRLAKGETLNELLPEAYAVVREAAKRTIGERPFDSQLMAAITLHEGKVAEQKTGEGKTLSAAPALYLNALAGKGCHLVTVNDYLARIGCGWMGPIYHLLGISVSALIHEQSFIFDPDFIDENAQDWRLKHLRPATKKEAYNADIVYGVNSEFGFDYLRDNMVQAVNEISQRGYYFAVVDEVDSVLIDEARTPHIISAPNTEGVEKCYEVSHLVEKLTPAMDFVVEEKHHAAHLTEHGIAKIEKILGIANIYEKDFETVHRVEAALKAKTLFLRDRDYIVREGEVIIVDEFTGRLMPGRRWSEGIHQAVEAKEGVKIQQESKTLATISLQNYFRMYEKLAGMTGTAVTEAEEFQKIYKLEVLVIPTNKPMVRKDNPDVVYKTQRAKYAAIAREIETCYKKGQPVLVGTTSIEKNEIINSFLDHKKVPHQVLNAKHHEKEAGIISLAGCRQMVTVATNMAGRGVDIILGGPAPKLPDGRPDRTSALWKKWQKDHEEIVSLGGLHIIGTERHESRRIDNQLRGRSGRQGDPGSSRFFIALDDDIMRLFGGDQVAKLMTFFNFPEDVPLEHSMVSKAIEQAQSKVEGLNFDTRKHLVEYDDIMNKQREIIYKLRRKVLETITSGEKVSDERPLKTEILDKVSAETETIVNFGAVTDRGLPDKEQIVREFSTIIPFDDVSKRGLLSQLDKTESLEEISKFLKKTATDIYSQREKQLGPELSAEIEKWTMLRVIDSLWTEHLDAVDDMREGIGLRGYGQRDPLVEYKKEAFLMFEKLMLAIDTEIVHGIFKVQVVAPPPAARNLPTGAGLASGAAAGGGHNKPGRNDPCWCGSGKKYKRCHYPS